ncbi:unnamed protein product [Amoebophrya sp. A120]|nr:unnamed protein product [Amoebophrya sp. A120]|eukprot:GSA120T00004287001.1
MGLNSALEDSWTSKDISDLPRKDKLKILAQVIRSTHEKAVDFQQEKHRTQAAVHTKHELIKKVPEDRTHTWFVVQAKGQPVIQLQGGTEEPVCYYYNSKTRTAQWDKPELSQGQNQNGKGSVQFGRPSRPVRSKSWLVKYG